MNKNSEKMYFKDEDKSMLYPLEHYLNEAKNEGLTEIELIEAIPPSRTSEPDAYWCSDAYDVVPKEDCKKSKCDSYDSKSGRGICQHRQFCWGWGEKVKFKVPHIDHKSYLLNKEKI